MACSDRRLLSAMLRLQRRARSRDSAELCTSSSAKGRCVDVGRGRAEPPVQRSAVRARPPSGGHGSESLFLVLLQMVHVEVARRFQPVLGHLHRHGPKQLSALANIPTTSVRRFSSGFRRSSCKTAPALYQYICPPPRVSSVRDASAILAPQPRD